MKGIEEKYNFLKSRLLDIFEQELKIIEKMKPSVFINENLTSNTRLNNINVHREKIKLHDNDNFDLDTVDARE